MVRIVGALMVAAGASALGIASAARLGRRVRSLDAVLSALHVMKSEICGRLTPLPDLLRLLGEEAQYPASLLFKKASDGITRLGSSTFSAIWREAVAGTPELMLSPHEELALSELGLHLGRYDAGQLEGQLEYAIARMGDFARRAEEEREKNAKVRAFLGVAAGLFAVVVLM